jgi:hypothetical protein
VRIVDHAKQRFVLSRLGEQAERGKRDEEAIVAPTRGQAKRPTQRHRLRSGKILDKTEHRADDLVQRRKGQVRLRFDPAASKDAHVTGSLARVLQKGRLADAGLARND